ETALDRKDSWLWEAWHWSHRAKSRTFRELLGSGHPRLKDADRSLWLECEELAKRLDLLTQEAESLRRTLSIEDEESPSEADLADMARRLELADEEKRRTQQLYDQSRRKVVDRIEGARELFTLDVERPHEIVAH